MMRSIAAVRGVLFAAVLSLACQRPTQGELRDGCPGCTWRRLGLHPQAAAQPTATGRALRTLCPWRGRLYIGYGDYQANTGPIAVTAWDPARNAFVTVHTSDTEAIPFAGRLVYATRHSYATPYAELNATPNRLVAFDGATAAVAFDRELLDFFGDDRALLVLDTDGAIWRTTDLARWSRAAVVTGFRPQSLALLDGALYVGTQDAELYHLVGWP